MPTYQWLSIGDTRIRMRLQTHGEKQEWHPVAQVTLRQIYEATPPMYYSWWCDSKAPIGQSKTLEQAIALTEAVMQASV